MDILENWSYGNNDPENQMLFKIKLDAVAKDRMQSIYEF